MPSPLLSQNWLSKAAKVNCPAPQPEDPRSELLAAMLFVAPYSAPEKKEKKKKAREGLRIKDQPDTVSEETHASSSHEEEQEDGGEGVFPLARKRAASSDAAEDAAPPALKRVRRARLILPDDSSDSDAESEEFEKVPQRSLRVKPPAQRYESEDSLGHLCKVFNVLNAKTSFNLQPTTRSPH